MPSELKLHTITVGAETDRNAYIYANLMGSKCVASEKKPTPEYFDKICFYKPIWICTTYIYLLYIFINQVLLFCLLPWSSL